MRTTVPDTCGVSLTRLPLTYASSVVACPRVTMRCQAPQIANTIATTPMMMSGRRLARLGGAAASWASFWSVMFHSRVAIARLGERGRIVRRTPPATPERAEEPRGIREALYIGLHLRQGRLLVLLFCRQNL